ncbi:hypothetical protein YC2023_122466 [Brassica napus]
MAIFHDAKGINPREDGSWIAQIHGINSREYRRAYRTYALIPANSENLKLPNDDGSLCGCGPCGPNNIERSISRQVAGAQPLMDLAGVGEVTGARYTGMHAVCLLVLMSGESGRGARKWQSTRRTRSELVPGRYIIHVIKFQDKLENPSRNERYLKLEKRRKRKLF